MNKRLIDKLHGIANIENEYYHYCCGQWLSPEDELEMAIAFGEESLADTVRNEMVEREIRIIDFMFNGQYA